jgi:hypothetical protein
MRLALRPVSHLCVCVGAGAELTAERIRSLRVKELRHELWARGVECVGCAQKEDLVARLIEVKHQPILHTGTQTDSANQPKPASAASAASQQKKEKAQAEAAAEAAADAEGLDIDEILRNAKGKDGKPQKDSGKEQAKGKASVSDQEKRAGTGSDKQTCRLCSPLCGVVLCCMHRAVGRRSKGFGLKRRVSCAALRRPPNFRAVCSPNRSRRIWALS